MSIHSKSARVHQGYWLRRAQSALFALGLGVMSFQFYGCEEADDSATAALTSPDVAATSGDGLRSLKLAELPASLSLTEDQSARLGTAIDKFNSAARERWGGPGGPGRDGKFGRGRGGRRHPGGPFGNDGFVGPPAGGPSMDGDDFERSPERDLAQSPFLTLVSESSAILNTDQFTTFAAYLSARRQQGRPDFGRGEDHKRLGGLGGRMGGRRLEGMARELELTADQRDAIQKVFQEHGEQSRAVMEQLRKGAIDADAARAQIKAIREDMKSDLDFYLTPQQREKAKAMKAEREAARVDRRIERLGEEMKTRVEFLDGTLALDDAQQSQVAAILQGTVAARTANLEAVKAGTLEPEDAAYKTLEIEKAAADQIRPVLNPDQLRRFEALVNLLPRGLRGGGRH